MRIGFADSGRASLSIVVKWRRVRIAAAMRQYSI